MKLIALILFFSFSAYLSEAVILPNRYTTTSQTKISRCHEKCKMMQKKNCAKETAKNKCNQGCSNCPVFASFYTNYINRIITISPVFALHYTGFVNRFISNYTGETFKPPNAV